MISKITLITAAALVVGQPLASQAATTNTDRTAAWFDAHKSRPTLLRQFVQRMPKGADLHSHISGAVYAESYLAWAEQAGYCANVAQHQMVEPPCAPDKGILPIQQLATKDRAAMVDLMSTRNLAYTDRSGHDQFFDSFSQFDKAGKIKGATVDMLMEVTQRAASQHILHLELMTTLQSSAVRKLSNDLVQALKAAGKPLTWKNDTELAEYRDWLMTHGLPNEVSLGRQSLDQIDANYAQRQGCGSAQAQSGCQVSVGWLQQTTRTAPPEQVFAQLAYAFELAAADRRVVGLNLVAPEDDPTALRDYALQMRMIRFLSKQHPQVRISLHAGELTLGLVPPEHLRFHIHDAVEVAGAHRLGHAVDIGYEDNAAALLQTMKTRDVAAEICLTSNDVILGVKGDDHPLPDYLAAGVPVVLASDDEGVSRIDLSNEYRRAAQTYNLGYRQLKQFSRNSLSYSFLTGDSLWRNNNQAQPVAACAKDALGSATPSAGCQSFLKGSVKAQRQWALEREFSEFEALPQWRVTGAKR